ncbi:MAG TPA: efflux RND transporter periplasmic adaptor subunit [Microvirga sp.]|nr:efflux RND transporter periplasmic adaptor subunit [Microvirga sp.]
MAQLLIWSGLAALCLALAACDGPPPAEPELRPVMTALARLQAMDEVATQTGEIRPRQETDLGFRLSGQLTERPVEVGAVVRKGDVLARIEDQELVASLRSAQAELRAAEAAEVQVRSEEGRQRFLVGKGIAASVKLEQATRELVAAVARVTQARANLQTAKDRLGYATLIADRGGVVTAVGANPGQVVAAGAMVVRVASVDEREAVFSISERLLKSAPADPEVEVSLVSDPSVTARGRVREVTPSADPATRTYTVRVALPEAPADMRMGSTVSGRLRWPAPAAVVLPSASLTSRDGAPAVFVVEPEINALALRPVTIARYEEARVRVAGGLSEGERVVVAGVNRLRAGQTVRPVDGGR